MKLYLSSYRLGNHGGKFAELVGKPHAKVAVSVNALDNILALARTLIVKREINDIKSLGFKAEELDLRKYFQKDGLIEKMKSYDAVWFSGGNTFLLVKAFKQSGFDKVLDTLVKTDQLVYAGYSAAFSAVSPSLHGVELVDNKAAKAKGYKPGVLWDGYGLIDFYPIVHFRSNHQESAMVEKEYAYVKANKIKHKTFHDGQVYIVNGSRQLILS